MSMDMWNLLQIRKPSYLSFLDVVGQSKIIHFFEYYMSKQKSDIIASPIYQSLINETNTYNKQVYIGTKSNIAYTSKGYIYINEDNVNPLSYGAKRFVMFHESRHIKYNDTIMHKFIINGLFMSVFYPLYHKNFFLKQNSKGLVPKLKAFTKSLCYIGIGIYFIRICMIIRKLDVETRADIEAAQEVKCHYCIKDWSDVTEINERSYSYLGKKELGIIRNHYLEHNMRCVYHE